MPTDKQRLDFLTRNSFGINKLSWGCFYVDFQYDLPGDTPRQAIDLAMKSKAKAKQGGGGA